MTEQQWLASTDPAAMLRHLNAANWSSKPDHPGSPSDRKLLLFACACCRTVWPLLANKLSWRAIEVAELYADGLADVTDLDKAHQEAVFAGGKDGRRGAAARAAWFTSDPERQLAGVLLSVSRASVSKEKDWNAGCRPEEVAAKTVQAAMLRDVFGNPWKRVTHWRNASELSASHRKAVGEVCGFHHKTVQQSGIHPNFLTWNDGAVSKLAQIMYDSRDFADMPKLGDMLEEAGCEGKDIWLHCFGKQLCPSCKGEGIVQGKVCNNCDSASNIVYPYQKEIKWAGSGVVNAGPHVRGCWVIDLILGKE